MFEIYVKTSNCLSSSFQGIIKKIKYGGVIRNFYIEGSEPSEILANIYMYPQAVLPFEET